MEQRHFSLIEGDKNAEKLVVAWEGVKTLHPRMEDRYEEWARLAQVPLTEVYRLAPTLFRYAFVYDDGTADEMAIRMCTAQMIARVTRSRGRRATAPVRTPTPQHPAAEESKTDAETDQAGGEG